MHKLENTFTMNDILDHDFENTPPGSTFAKLAFGMAMFTLCMFGYILARYSGKVRADDFAHLWIFTSITQFSILMGLIFSVVSMVRREKLRFIKGVGIGLNFFFFFLVLGASGFAMWMDGMGE